MSRELSTALLPNKRLKLTGGDRLKGSGVLCPGGHGLSSDGLAPAGGAPPALARSVRRRASPPQTSFRQVILFGECAGPRAPMLASEDLFAAPHTPRPCDGGAAPRTSFRRVVAYRQVLNPRRRGHPGARGAFEHRCQARRLTCAWS